ncbi:MAG: Ig-like domain-containing protein [Candidatus Solibacter usitatus]|nr:Ig-like domain-containing protein [Candidatus Solibacter usitatus]
MSMNLRRILIPALIGMSVLTPAANARYVFVLPPAGSLNPALQAFNDQLQSMGSVAIPAGASQVLTSATGDKAIVIAQNGSAGVSFVNIQGGQLSGTARSLSLDNLIPSYAVMTPDGLRLLVLTGGSPGTLFVIDALTETIQTAGRITIGSTPRDIVVTQDSRYAFVVSTPGLLTVIDLSTNQIHAQSGIAGLVGSANLSLSPSGSVYVTGQYLLIEYEGKPPFSERGRTQVISSPGKLSFSPDGRYALASNDLGNGSSIVTFDLETRGPTSPAGAPISAIPITLVGSNSPIKLDRIWVINDKSAIVFSSAAQKLYLVNYPALTAADLSLGGVGVPQLVAGANISNEFPSTRNFYYSTGGLVYRQDILANVPLGSASVASGTIAFAAQPSLSSPSQIFGYGVNQLVGPNTAARPYYIRVVDGSGRPVFNASVSFVPETAGVTLTNASTATNIDGYAQVTATSPAANGPFSVKAQVGAVSLSLTSTVTGGTSGGGGGGGGGAGDIPKVLKISGDGQLVQIFSGFTRPLVIRVEDSKGNPIAGKQVIWTESGGVNWLGPTTTTTDANGMTQMTVIPGGSPGPGVPFLTYTITANTDIGNASFTMVSYPFQQGGFNPQPTVVLQKPPQENRSVTAKLGVKQDGAISVIVVTSGGLGGSPGMPIPGVGIMLNNTTNQDPKLGPVAKCEGGTVLTGQDGIANCNLIVEGKVGASDIQVDVGAMIAQTVRLVVTAGDPIAPVIVQGNNQTGKPGATLPLALTARITDGFGNVLPGTNAVWEVATPSSVRLFNTISTSDSNGLVSTQVQIGANAGKFQVKLKAGGKETIFDITIETLAVAIVKVGGENQPSIPIGQAFPQPLVVYVTDGQSRPVQGASVGWVVTGGAASLGAASSVTGADGRAQITVTAGSTPGTITVSATVSGLSPVVFSLQSRLPGPGLTNNSFVNYASGELGLAPGNLVLIVGAGLAPNVRGQMNANLLGGRLPYDLANVVVEFQFSGRSVFAPIYRVSNENGVESVLVQAPWELSATSTATAVVNVSGGTTSVSGLQVRTISPGVLEDFISGRRAAVVIRSDGLVVTPETPARRGETVRLYAIGLGQTGPMIAETNRVGVPDQQKAKAVVAVGVDDKGVQTLSVHLAENLVGVYEVVFVIPSDATIGADRPLGFVVEAVPGQPVYANGSVISIGQ